MKDDKTRGCVLLVAIGLLWFILATKTPDTWQWPDIVIMIVGASLLTPTVLGWLRIIGLGYLADWALDAIGYHEEQQFNGFLSSNGGPPTFVRNVLLELF